MGTAVTRLDRVDWRGQLYPVQHGGFGGTASGDNTLISPSNSDNIIVVLSVFILAHAAANVYFKSEDGTVIFGDSTHKLPISPDGSAGPGGFSLERNYGVMQTTTAGDDVELVTDGAVAFSGGASWIELPSWAVA